MNKKEKCEMKRNLNKFHKLFRICRLGLFAFLLVTMMSGCGKVDPVTATDFQTAMKGMGYNVSDTTSNYAEYDFVQKCVDLEDSDLHVKFCETTTRDDAIGLYNAGKNAVESNKMSGSIETNVENNSYCRYKLKSGGTYYLVEQAGNTVINAYCSTANAQKLDDIIKAINY